MIDLRDLAIGGLLLLLLLFSSYILGQRRALAEARATRDQAVEVAGLCVGALERENAQLRELLDSLGSTVP